jgi:thiamine pyrophosphokinase
MRTAYVLAGGEPISGGVFGADETAVVIAADSGLQNAEALDMPVDVIVGDLDSADLDAVEAAVAAGARIERHRPDKDATDLELALDCAQREGATRIVVIGGGGGRVDHFLANVMLLAHPRYAGIALEAYMDDAHIHVARGGEPPVAVHGPRASIVTLLPIGGPARGIVTDGLQYPLRAEDLGPGTTRGVSNVLAADRATVALAEGALIVVRPLGADS